MKLAIYHRKKLFLLPHFFDRKHIMLPQFIQYTILLWILFGAIVLLIIPIYIIAQLFKLLRYFVNVSKK